MLLLLICINIAALLKQACLIVCLHTCMHASKGALGNRSLCSMTVYVFQVRVTYLQILYHRMHPLVAELLKWHQLLAGCMHSTQQSHLPHLSGPNQCDYRAALSSGNQSPLPYQAAFKSVRPWTLQAHSCMQPGRPLGLLCQMQRALICCLQHNKSLLG